MADLMTELMSHYEQWTNDNKKRATRKDGWNDITDAYYGKLPADWAYFTRIVDPRLRTSLIEKNARLMNGKLRGRLSPREGGDLIKASIHNALLDFQWDQANDGGSMQTKMSVCDMDTRLYQSKFALVKWLCKYDEDGEVMFEGNEMTPLDIRDCGLDPAASHIKDAKWFQWRRWEFLEDLEAQVDVDGKPAFKNISKIKRSLAEKLPNSSSRKSNAYVSRVKQLRGLEDRTGTDIAFPVVMVVTEFREDGWVDFCPDYKMVIREIDNPYKHKKIPVAQLRYYPLQDDNLGESEAEPVLPLWRAIQAVLCGYMDEVVLKMQPPLKVIENAARVETIQYFPGAQWIVDRPDAVTEMQSNGEAQRYFQTTYSALISAFNTAMGDLSQGTSTISPFEADKTATEVKASLKQQNVRDQKNQNDLGEFIKDIMMMWLSNNQQFLFGNSDKEEYLIKVLGREQFDIFKQAGFDEDDVSPEVMKEIGDIVEQNPEINDTELQSLLEAGSTPRFPVYENKDEKDPNKIKFKKKMTISDDGGLADIYITPEDLDGVYDYIPDVKSMASGATQELMDGRMKALELIKDPNMLQLMGDKIPDAAELIIGLFEDFGLKDARRYFKTKAIQPQAPIGALSSNGANPQVGGLPAAPQAGIGAGIPQPMAGSLPIQGLGGIS